MSQSSAFADAVQRARQIAAKINPTTGAGDVSGTKRPLEDAAEPESKKLASVNDPFGAQLAALRGGSSGGSERSNNAYSNGIQSRNPNESTGSSGSGGPVMGGSSHAGLGAIITEEIKVPDKMVGLIIGRGGEQITRLQADSGAKIQMAPDSGGMPDRLCTLQGTREAVSRARDLIMEIVQQRGPNDMMPSSNHMGLGGHNTVELMIPGPKVGLIIGKGGEMIRQLQEKAGVKMVFMIPKPGMDNPYAQGQETEKPLRISGDPQKCEYAKQMVYDLIAEREMQEANQFGAGRGRGRGNPSYDRNEYGGPGGPANIEVTVPQPAVGLVIGKGGDMIKKIQAESGARVQFQNARSDIPGDKICHLSGKPEQVQEAKRAIMELIESVMGDGMGRGRGGPMGRPYNGHPGNRGRGGWGGPPPGSWENGDYGSGHIPSRSGSGEKQEVTYPVPASKCGLVIGKGGETIRQINQQTGAFCQLDPNPPANPEEKVFLIKGTPDQVDAARRLIAEKVGLGPPPPPQQSKYSMAPNAPQAPPPQAYAPQGWSNAYQHWQSPGSMPADGGGPPSSAQQPDYSAQWVEYYRSLGLHEQADMAAQQQAPSSQAGSAVPSQPVDGKDAPKDYSAQWADYYRSQGMYKEAEMIEQQAKAQKAAAAATGQNPPAPGTQPAQMVPPAPAPGAPYSQQPYPQYPQQYPQYYGGQQPGYSYQGYPSYPGYTAPRQE